MSVVVVHKMDTVATVICETEFNLFISFLSHYYGESHEFPSDFLKLYNHL